MKALRGLLSLAVLVLGSIFFPLVNLYSQEINYVPLSQGTQWTYQVTETYQGKGRMVAKIDGTITIASEVYSVMKYIYSEGLTAESYTCYFRKESDGIYMIDGRYSEALSSNKYKRKYLPIPLEIEKFWQIKLFEDGYTELYNCSIKEKTNVQTLDNQGNMKEFKDCIHVQRRIGDIFGASIIKEYYSQNIGLVMMLETEDGEVTRRCTLEKYAPGTGTEPTWKATNTPTPPVSVEKKEDGRSEIKTENRPVTKPTKTYSEIDLINVFKKADYIITGGKNYTVRWVSIPNPTDRRKILEYIDNSKEALNTAAEIARSLSNNEALGVIAECEGCLDRDRDNFNSGGGGKRGLRDAQRVLRDYLKGK